MRFIILTALGLYVAATGVTLQEAGSAVRTEYFVDLYRVTVFDSDGTLTREDLSAPDKPLRITLDVLYDGELPDIPETWSEELMPQIPAGDVAELRSAYKDLSEGDRVVVRFVPDEGTEIRLNGSLVISDPGYDLAKATLDIWFGRDPVSGDVKHEILRG